MTHQDLADRIDQPEARYDQPFRTVFEAIRGIIAPDASPSSKKEIGIHNDGDGK